MSILADGGGSDLELSGHLAGGEPLCQEFGGSSLAFGECLEPCGKVNSNGGFFGGSEASVGGGEPVLPGSCVRILEVFEGEDAESGDPSNPGMVEVAGASTEVSVGADGAAIFDAPAGEFDDCGNPDVFRVPSASEESVPGHPCGGSGLGEGLVAMMSRPFVMAKIVSDGGFDAWEGFLEVALGAGNEVRFEAKCVGHGSDLW